MKTRKCPNCSFDNRATAVFCGNCGGQFPEEGWYEYNRNNMNNTHIPRNVEEYGSYVMFTELTVFGYPLLAGGRLISPIANSIEVISIDDIYQLSGFSETSFPVGEGIVKKSSPASIPPYIYYSVPNQFSRYHIGKPNGSPELILEDAGIGYSYPLTIRTPDTNFILFPIKNSSALMIIEVDKHHKIGESMEIGVEKLFSDKNDKISHLVFSPTTMELIVISKFPKIYRISVPDFAPKGDGEFVVKGEKLTTSVPCIVDKMLYLMSSNEKNDISLIAKDLTKTDPPKFFYFASALPDPFKREFFANPPLAIRDGVALSKDQETIYTLRLDRSSGEFDEKDIRVTKNGGHWRAISVGKDILYLADNRVWRMDITNGSEDELWVLRETEGSQDDKFIGFFFFDDYLLMLYDDGVVYSMNADGSVFKIGKSQ